MLQDDYVKFIRFGQWRINRTGKDILGFITNHSYLDNITFQGMRQSLMDTFTDIYILNLRGNVKKIAWLIPGKLLLTSIILLSFMVVWNLKEFFFFLL